MSDRAKIRARRVTGNSTQQQRDVAMAIKNAREMALLPYTNRITTTRGGRGGDRRGRDDRGRDDRDDNRPPREERAEKADSDQSQIRNSSSTENPVENVEAQVETQMPTTETNETSETLTKEETTE